MRANRIFPAFFLSLMISGISLFAQDTSPEPADAQSTKPQEAPQAAAEAASPKLTIGSDAPELDIEHWLTDDNGLFVHTRKFEPGMVYVIDFWTLQNPEAGVLSLPVMAQLQSQHPSDKLQIITVGDLSWQAAEDFLDTDVPEDNALKKGQSYRDLVERMCFTSDPDGSVFKDYMEDSERIFFSSFIVGKDGKIEWIGLARDLKKPLEQVLQDKWDRKKFAKTYAKELDEARQQEQVAMEVGRAMSKIIAELRGKMSEGPEVGLEYLKEQAEAAENPRVAQAIAELRLQLILRVQPDTLAAEIRAYAEKYIDNEDSAVSLNNFIWEFIYEPLERGNNVPDELIEAGTEAMKIAVKYAPTSGAVLDTMAHFAYVNGELDQAIDWQKKAVAATEDLRAEELKPFLDKLINEKETGEKAIEFKRPKKKKEKADF